MLYACLCNIAAPQFLLSLSHRQNFYPKKERRKINNPEGAGWSVVLPSCHQDSFAESIQATMGQFPVAVEGTSWHWDAPGTWINI